MGFFVSPLRPKGGKMKTVLSIIIMIALMAAYPVNAYESGIKDIIHVGTAFATNLTVHEYGHAIVGSSVGAEGISVSFISKDAILTAAVTQSVLNAYRVYSGSDKIMPYMTFSKDSIGFHVKVAF